MKFHRVRITFSYKFIIIAWSIVFTTMHVRNFIRNHTMNTDGHVSLMRRVVIPVIKPVSRFPIYKVYPKGGTGIDVNITGVLDESVINNLCYDDMKLTAVLPIYSTVSRFETRAMLRRTLGKWAKMFNCKIYFIIGISPNMTVNEMMYEEYYRERDLQVMPKMDSYRNLNDKATIMVEWLSKYCAHIPYVIHLIDDTFINLEMFLSRLPTIRKVNYMLGGKMMPMKSPRNPSLKTHVTKEEYPDAMFPKYAIGFGYAWPGNVSALLYSAVYTAKYCWIEDVWFCGHVRKEAGVKLIGFQREEWRSNENKPIPNLLSGLPPYFMIHSVEPDLMEKLYSWVVENNKDDSRPNYTDKTWD